jgi:hypothetical protein
MGAVTRQAPGLVAHSLLPVGGIEITFGVWGDDLAGHSSNFRELFNLTDALEAKAASLLFDNLARLVDSVEAQTALYPSCEVYMLTDNAVAEGAFHRGTSSNRRLFDLVLRMKHLELHRGVQLHVIHITGTRMQAQGTDALSRSDLISGVMNAPVRPLPSFGPRPESYPASMDFYMAPAWVQPSMPHSS